MTHLLSLILSIGLTVFFYCIVQQALEAVFASSWSYQKRLLLRSRYTPFQRLRLYPVREHHHPDYGELVVLLTGLLRIRVGAFLALPMLTYLSVRDPQLEVAVTCPYSFFERARLEVESHGGIPGEVEYAADVTIHALLPIEKEKSFTERMTELTAGGIVPVVCGETFRPAPLKPGKQM